MNRLAFALLALLSCTAGDRTLTAAATPADAESIIRPPLDLPIERNLPRLAGPLAERLQFARRAEQPGFHGFFYFQEACRGHPGSLCSMFFDGWVGPRPDYHTAAMDCWTREGRFELMTRIGETFSCYMEEPLPEYLTRGACRDGYAKKGKAGGYTTCSPTTAVDYQCPDGSTPLLRTIGHREAPPYVEEICSGYFPAAYDATAAPSVCVQEGDRWTYTPHSFYPTKRSCNEGAWLNRELGIGAWEQVVPEPQP